MFSKIATQAFEAGDFLSIFLNFFGGVWGSFSYKKLSYKKKHVVVLSFNPFANYELKFTPEWVTSPWTAYITAIKHKLISSFLPRGGIESQN